MSAWVAEYQYVVAWAVYLASGGLLCCFWWRITRRLQHPGWRDLLRGISLVLIFTPWYSSGAHEYYAPAIIVTLMELLLGSTGNGLSAVLILLLASALMLAILLLRRLPFFAKGKDDAGQV